MIRTLAGNWRLLALCGVLYASISAIYFAMQSTDGPLTIHAWNGVATLLGRLVLAAGACAIVAGLWRSVRGKCWPLALSGLALLGLGVIYSALRRYPISLLTIALLIIVTAVSGGILELEAARALRLQGRVGDRWFLLLAGVAAFGFAGVFLALGLHWIPIAPGSRSDFLWFGSYFAFSAVCMLELALRLRGPGLSLPSRGDVMPAGNPRHAH